MAAPPPTFSLAALFGAQPPDPHLSLYEAASRQNVAARKKEEKTKMARTFTASVRR
jgi:hypothetical protein